MRKKSVKKCPTKRKNRNRRSFCEQLELRQLLAVTNFTVAGTAMWTDSASNTHPIPMADVEVVEHDGTTETVIATGMTDAAGMYNFNVSHDDGADGGPDVTVRILSRSSVADIKTLAPNSQNHKLESTKRDNVAEGAIVTHSPTAGNTSANDSAFSVHHALIVAGQYVSNLAGASLPQADVFFPGNDTSMSSTSTGAEIELLIGDRWDWDVIQHEYGHYFTTTHGIENSPGGDHDSADNLSVTPGPESVGLPLAWDEGYSTFFGIAGQRSTGAASLMIPNVGDTRYQDTEDLNVDDNLETETGVGEDNEQSVMSMLWDLFDAASTGELDELNMSDRTIFTTLKNAGATTTGTAWKALADATDNPGKARLGEIFAHNKISPSQKTPADNAAMGNTPPKFTWDKNGDTGSKVNPLNEFRIRFYKSDFTTIVHEKDLGDVDEYTPSQADWDTIRAESTIKWVVEGRNTTGVTTPTTSATDYYWSGARTLGGVNIAMVIDDTGSMSEEISGVRTALQQYIDALASGLAPGVDPPAIQLITFKDSVTTRITSNDLTAVRNAVGALRASGGGDCPEFSAHGLATAVENVAPGGTILLATDAAPQPGIDYASVLREMRAKGITLNTILTGDCTGISSSRTAQPTDAVSEALLPSRGKDAGSRHADFVSDYIPVSKFDESESPSTPPLSQQDPVRRGAAFKRGAEGEDSKESRDPVALPFQPAIDDHSNSTAGATTLVVGGNRLLGTVGATDDPADFFAIDLTAGTRPVIEITDADSIRVEILAPNGVDLLSTRTVFGDGSIVFEPPTSGTHFVKVTNAGSGTDLYSIAATENPFGGLTSAVDVFSTISAQTGGTFLVRDGINAGSPDAFVASIFNVLASTLGPTVIAASPTTVPRGETLAINVEGAGTNWRPGDTTVAFSNAGIQVLDVEVTSPTSLRATLQIQSTTPLGSYDITVTTGFGEVSRGQRILEVGAESSAPRLLTATPSKLLTGTAATVDLFGANVTWDGTSTISLGPDITINEVRVISPTQLQADVTTDSLADIGFRTARVTTGTETVQLSRAIFVDVATAGIPQVVSVAPDAAGLGDTLTVKVTAENTNFIDGVTTATFGDEVEVLSVTVSSPTEADVEVKVADDATSGFRNVILNTGGEFAVLIGGFFVEGIDTGGPVVANEFQPAVDIFNVDGREVDGIDGITLSGSAFDVEEGDISGRLSWTSSRDGFLGVGASVKTPLSAGSHVITALATDSGGFSGSDSITVFVPQTQVGVAIEGSTWDTPLVPLREETSVASNSVNRFIVVYPSPPDAPPTIQVTSADGAEVPEFLLVFWDGKEANFESLAPLSAGQYTAVFNVPGSTKTVNFGIADGTTNAPVSPEAVDNVFADVAQEAPIPEPEPVLLAGDATGDGVVDFGDFAIIAANFGRTDATLAEGDLDDDGIVGFADFAILAVNFGRRVL